MGNEASSLMNDLQTNIENKLERFQTSGLMRHETANNNGTPITGVFFKGDNNDDLKEVLANHDEGQKKNFADAVQRVKENEIPKLSEDQKRAIRASWSTLTTEMETIGVLTFLHMFEKHPSMKDNFKSFKHLSQHELQGNEIFHNHAARVVNVVKKVIEKIDTPEVYINYLTTLGRKHIMYEAQPEYLDQVGYLFLTSIKAVLEKEGVWDEETSDAWECLFLIILGTMRKAIEGEM